MSFSLLQEWVNEPSRSKSNEELDNKSRVRDAHGMQLSSSIVSDQDSPLYQGDKKADVNMGERDLEDDGSRPIHFAAYHGNQQLIDILINSGADCTLPNSSNLNVLHMAAQGDSPFSLILFKNNFKDIFHDINIRDTDDSSPLHWACFCNSHRIINFLISLGAERNSVDKNGATPLHIALQRFDWRDKRKSLITVQRLYNSGADPKIKDLKGKTPLDLAKEFPDAAISAALLDILKAKKIQQLWGDDHGRLRLVSFAFGFLMTCLIGGYLALVYASPQYRLYETIAICSLAAISLINYIYAVYIRPEYAQLPKIKSDEALLSLLRRTHNQPDVKICAYC